jgi:hypothetical protein
MTTSEKVQSLRDACDQLGGLLAKREKLDELCTILSFGASTSARPNGILMLYLPAPVDAAVAQRLTADELSTVADNLGDGIGFDLSQVPVEINDSLQAVLSYFGDLVSAQVDAATARVRQAALPLSSDG